MNNNNKLNISIKEGVSKKTNKAYTCLELTIGDYSTLIFPRTKFELEYVKKILDEESGKK